MASRADRNFDQVGRGLVPDGVNVVLTILIQPCFCNIPKMQEPTFECSCSEPLGTRFGLKVSEKSTHCVKQQEFPKSAVCKWIKNCPLSWKAVLPASLLPVVQVGFIGLSISNITIDTLFSIVNKPIRETMEQGYHMSQAFLRIQGPHVYWIFWHEIGITRGSKVPMEEKISSAPEQSVPKGIQWQIDTQTATINMHP